MKQASGCKDTGGTERAVPTCPCSGCSLLPSWRWSHVLLCLAVHHLPSRRSRSRATLLRAPAFGVPLGWDLQKQQPLQCLNEVAFFPLPIRARKNYSSPGICSGRAQLKSLSWAWQPRQRSRQLVQGQPWRMQSSGLTLQEEEEPCSAGPVPLSSCHSAAGWVMGCGELPTPMGTALWCEGLSGCGCLWGVGMGGEAGRLAIRLPAAPGWAWMVGAGTASPARRAGFGPLVCMLRARRMACAVLCACLRQRESQEPRGWGTGVGPSEL